MLMIMNFVVPVAAVPVEAGKEVRLLRDLPPSKKKSSTDVLLSVRLRGRTVGRVRPTLSRKTQRCQEAADR